MDSQSEEIQNLLISGNFLSAFQIAEKWLNSFSLSEKKTPGYATAREAYIYARFLLNRHERIASVKNDYQRARMFIQFLKEFEEVRKESKIDLQYDRTLFLSVTTYMNAQVADGYARAFSGQKMYNLEEEEILQLAASLIRLERFKPALEALNFIVQFNRNNPSVNFLLSICYFNLNQSEDFLKHYREALFVKPEIVFQYGDFFPGGIFRKTWESLETLDGSLEYRSLNYALLLEINGIYKTTRELTGDEMTRLVNDFEGFFRAYKAVNSHSSPLYPRMLLHLTRIIGACNKQADYENFEIYRQKLIKLSPDTWELLSGILK